MTVPPRGLAEPRHLHANYAVRAGHVLYQVVDRIDQVRVTPARSSSLATEVYTVDAAPPLVPEPEGPPAADDVSAAAEMDEVMTMT